MTSIRADVATVLWKEWRELFFENGKPRLSVLSGLSLVGVFGIALPVLTVLPVRFELRGTAASLSLQLVLTGIVVVGLAAGIALIVDAIAGERERHTLESLLATPLDVRALLLGKILAVGLYAWVLALLTGAVGILTVLVVFGAQRVELPSPVFLVLLAALSLLVAVFLLTVGALIGLRSSSVKQGQQVLMAVAFPLFVLLPLSAAFPRVPVLRDVVALAEGVGAEASLALLVLVVGALDAVAFQAALRQFRRERLLAL